MPKDDDTPKWLSWLAAKPSPGLRKWLEDDARHEELGKLAGDFTDALSDAFGERRVITCPGVAIITIAKSVSGMFKSLSDDEQKSKEKDEQIATVLGAVLRANPKADLSPYEAAFAIRILNVQSLGIDFTAENPMTTVPSDYHQHIVATPI